MTEKTITYSPCAQLKPRTPTLVGSAAQAVNDGVLHRVVDALRVGDGFLVTVVDLWIRTNCVPPPLDGDIERYLKVLSPVPSSSHTQCTSFYTTMRFDQIRAAFFEELQVAHVEADRSATP